MRIGYDAKRLFHNSSGLGNYSRDLVRILATQLPKSIFFLYNPKNIRINRWKPLTNTVEKQPTGFWRKLHFIWRQGPIVRQLTKDGIDLYHGLSGELPIGLKIPSVVTIHDLIFYRYPELYNPIDVFIHKRKVRHAVRAATKIVAISQQTKSDIIKFTGISEAKIEVIYQGCHPIFKKIFTENEKESIRKKYHLPKKFVLSVGTLEARKNALSIAKELKETSHSIVFVGKEKAYGKKLKTFVEENKMLKRVVFINNISIEDLAGIYQTATVFCYPSLFEGFGIPIIEALYSGVPVITTQGGCFSEAGGPYSIYIDLAEEGALRNAVEKLYAETKNKRKIRVNRGFQHIKQFNDEVLAMQWDVLYKNILSK